MIVSFRPAYPPIRDTCLHIDLIDVPGRDVTISGAIPFVEIQLFGIYLALREFILRAVIR